MDIQELRLEALKLARDAFGGDHTPADLLVSEADKLMAFIEEGTPKDQRTPRVAFKQAM